MTAYEMVDGKYYEQGSEEHYAALEASEPKAYPSMDLGRFLGFFMKANKVGPEDAPLIVAQSAQRAE